MRINTTAYEAAHGHKPRGHGLWFFKITFADSEFPRTTSEIINASGTMGAARKKAWAEIKATAGRSIRITGVTVLP